MAHYLQTFKPCESDPITALVTNEKDLVGNGTTTLMKSKAKEVPLDDVSRIIFGEGFLFQSLTPHEMNMHSLGEQLTHFSTQPFTAPSLNDFMAVTKELLAGLQPQSTESSHRFYNNGGLSPTAFRVVQRHSENAMLTSQSTHFVGDVMLLGTFVDFAKALDRFGAKTPFDIDFIGELSQARRTIEAKADVISVFHEDNRPVVLPIPYFDGNNLSQPPPVLLQPGDVVWNTNGEAIYLLNEFTISHYKLDSKSALPNRTFVTTTEDTCRATTLVGYGRNMHNILRCGLRSIIFGPK